MYIPNHVSRSRSYNHTSVPLCFCGDILISCKHYTKVICQEGLEDKAHAHKKPGACFLPFSTTSLLEHAHHPHLHPCSDASARRNSFLACFFFFKPHIFKQHPLLPDHAHLFLQLPILFAGVDEQQGQRRHSGQAASPEAGDGLISPHP